MTKRADRTTTLRTRLSRLGLVAVAVAVVAGGAWLYVASRSEYVVKRTALEAAAPKLLGAYGSFDGRSRCDDNIVCKSPTCHKVSESVPFEYRSVCYLGRAEHFTVMLTVGSGGHYRDGRGVFFRPDSISPDPDGICTRHVFGRWWEFAPLDDPNCPSGYDTYTGEG